MNACRLGCSAGSVLVLLLSAAPLAADGCSTPEKVERYRTRGLLEAIEGQGEDLRLEIHHERIAAFKDRAGKASPMEAMAMRFSVSDGLDTRSLRPGTKLELDFEVHWSSGSPLVITALRPLPPDTKLDLPPPR